MAYRSHDTRIMTPGKARTADTLSDVLVEAMTELLAALDENSAGMPVDSSESAGAWFARSDRRVASARARCAEIINAREASKTVR